MRKVAATLIAYLQICPMEKLTLCNFVNCPLMWLTPEELGKDNKGNNVKFRMSTQVKLQPTKEFLLKRKLTLIV